MTLKKISFMGKKIGFALLALFLLFLALCVVFAVCNYSLLATACGLLMMAFLIATCIFTVFAPKLNGKSMDKFVAGLPEIKVSGKIIDKNLATGSMPAFSISGLEIGQIYTVTIELQDKNRMFFNVTQEQYNTILVNDEGILTYKENGQQRWLINFKPQ